MALNLFHGSNANIKIKWAYCVRDAGGKELVYSKTKRNEEFTKNREGCNTNFAKRSILMNSLVDGSLVIEVRMKPPTSIDKSITLFIPANPINKNVLQKFMHEESADVVFEVDNGSCQSEEHINKKSKTTTTFYAHRFILQDISTMLAELCKPTEGEGITTVSIADVKPKIFKHMLYYTYGGKLADDDIKANSKEIINACDKYGVVHLKLEAEATYVNSTVITLDNMMDNLLYADSKNLALLKEAVMDYIVANKDDVMGKVSFSNLPSYMMTDLLAAVSRGEQQNDTNSAKTNYNKMRVGTLRKMLDEKGLDVDGSRESMIALLKEHSD